MRYCWAWSTGRGRCATLKRRRRRRRRVRVDRCGWRLPWAQRPCCCRCVWGGRRVRVRVRVSMWLEAALGSAAEFLQVHLTRLLLQPGIWVCYSQAPDLTACCYSRSPSPPLPAAHLRRYNRCQSQELPATALQGFVPSYQYFYSGCLPQDPGISQGIPGIFLGHPTHLFNILIF